MAEFASRGVAGVGLGTGIAGLALTTQAKFGCLDGTVANMMGTLGKITDTIVPMSAICPTPMAKYNSWTAPTNTPATGA